MFSNIIAAVDGSDISFLALDRAIEIAKQNNAKLHAIYVIESHAMSSSPLDTSGDMHHRRLEKEAALGREYKNDITSQIIRYSAMVLDDFDSASIEKMCRGKTDCHRYTYRKRTSRRCRCKLCGEKRV